MDAMTPYEKEILRLWGVIRELRANRMTDKEEAVFGEVYQEFKRTETLAALTSLADDVLPYQSVENRRKYLVVLVANGLRALHDMEQR